MNGFDRRLHTPAHSHGVNPYPAAWAAPRRRRLPRVLLALLVIGAAIALLAR